MSINGNYDDELMQVAQNVQDIHLNTSDEEGNYHGLEMSYSAKRLKTGLVGDDDNGDGTSIQEYPYDLQKLLLPMWCLLCKIRANSAASAADHYNSKGHKQKIECWLQENLPKESIDEAKDEGNKEGEANDLFCQLCDLKFTSVAHAKQHYDGRKHKLAHFRKFGAHIFDKNGKWQRFGPNSEGPLFDVISRFGLGGGNNSFKKPLTPTPPPPPPPPPSLPSLASFVQDNENKFGVVKSIDFEECLKMVEEESRLEKLFNDQQAEAQSHKLYCELCDLTLCSVFDAKRHYAGRKHIAARDKQAKSTDAASKLTTKFYDDGRFGIGEAFLKNNVTNTLPPSEFWCSICNIILSSLPDLELHRKGVKHLMKAEKLKECKQTDADLNLKYRLPSGAYYCDVCNVNFNGISTLTSHLSGKKHVKKQSLLAEASKQ